MPTRIELSGFKEFHAKMKAKPKEILSQLDGEVEEAANHWTELAKKAAHNDTGFLRRGIEPKRIADREWEVASNAEYSAYMEWGTGKRVKVPADLQNYASQFKGKGGSAEDAKKMIYAWMIRVGIPEEERWGKFISIMTHGVKPHPFFFVQRPIVEKEFIKNVKSLLK